MIRSLGIRAGLAGLIIAGLAAAPAAAVQTPQTDEFYSGPPEIVLYDGPNFSGRSLTLNAEAENLDRQGFNDRATSVRVVRGNWEICEHSNYGGYCQPISEDVRSLTRMNNEASSVRLRLRRPDGGGNGGGRGSLTFFSGPNYTGRSITVRDAAPDFSRLGFNDLARSIRHNGGGSWRVCQHANYGGACMEVSGDLRDLGVGGMAGEISSATPDFGGGGRPGGPGGGGRLPAYGVWLYDGSNFGGQRFEVDRDVPNLDDVRFNDRADSMRVARGETWEICEDSYYRGRCEYVDGGEIASLFQFGLGNRISSLRQVDSGWRPGRPGGPVRPGWGDPGWGGRIDGGVEGITTTFFPVPEVNGQAIDRCVYPGRDCDTVAADQICQAAGHREAAYFTVDRGRRYRTTHIGTGRSCQTGRCEAMLDVLCID